MDTEAATKAMLLRRYRCVAFAALGAKVTKAELLEALETAVEADQRREAARPHLELVRSV